MKEKIKKIRLGLAYDEAIRDFGRKLLEEQKEAKKIRITLRMTDGRVYEYNSDDDFGSEKLIKKRKKRKLKEAEEWC